MPLAANQLTQYLLDSSLIEYTTSVAEKALSLGDPALQTQAKRKAISALNFFLDILEPSIEEERRQLEIFRSYYVAIKDSGLASEVDSEVPSFSGTPTEISDPEASDPTAAQRVLSLPDTLNLIFSYIPIVTEADRDSFRQVALTSRVIYSTAQSHLWGRRIELTLVEQQVRFAFCLAISGVDGKSVGHCIKQLRITLTSGGWNFRLVEKIAALAPGVVELFLQWGNPPDVLKDHPVTQETIASLHKILSYLPNLTRLSFLKVASTFRPEGEDKEFHFPTDAHVPFTRLKTLQFNEFCWYWLPISRGLGPSLKGLVIGFETKISADEMVALSAKLTSLTTLLIENGLDAPHLRRVIENLPTLERIHITNIPMEDGYVDAVVPSLAGLKSLKELSFNAAVGSAQLRVLCSLRLLELIALKLKVDNEVEDALEDLLKKNGQTLKNVRIRFEEDALAPSDKLIQALASAPRLEQFYVDFDFELPSNVSDSSISKLVLDHPELRWTSTLESLIARSSLYENESDEEYEETEEDNVGN